MQTVRQCVGRFLADESGATAIEYALIGTGIAVAIAAAITSIGTSISNRFVAVSTALK